MISVIANFAIITAIALLLDHHLHINMDSNGKEVMHLESLKLRQQDAHFSESKAC
jgi:hypothetical protein